MLKMFCDRCQKEIIPQETIIDIQMDESDYLRQQEVMKLSSHQDYHLQLCNRCKYKLFQFLKLVQEENTKLPWE